MSTNNNLLAWLQENFQRLSTKSPKFFQVWNIVNGAVALLAGIPTLLISFDIVLPPAHWADVLLKIASGCATWGFFMSKLTTQRPTVTATGDVVEPTKVNSQGDIKPVEMKPLAFTDKVEAKKVDAGLTTKVAVDAVDAGVQKP